MKKITFIFALIALAGGACRLQAAGKPGKAAGGGMAGTWGLGAANVPAAAGTNNAITGTYWVMDALAIDGLLGVGTATTAATVAGSSASTTDSSFLIGAAGRYDLAKPTPDLHLQVVGRLSYANSTAGGSTVDMFAGGGFEGFIFGGHSVSLEVNTGVHAYLSSMTNTYGVAGYTATVAQTGFYLGGGNGMLPVNLALHCYF